MTNSIEKKGHIFKINKIRKRTLVGLLENIYCKISIAYVNHYLQINLFILNISVSISNKPFPSHSYANNSKYSHKR